ncbi:MAG: ABC transporter ATP-binding protein [Polyangiales bacterium]
MIESIRQFYDLLTPPERSGAMKVLLMMCALALLEATGVASIMPFLAVLSSPDLIESNSALAKLSAWTGITSSNDLLILTGSLVFCLVLSALLLQALVVWGQVRYAGDLMHSWSCRIVQTYLRQPYEWFLGRHTSELSATTINEVNQAIYHAVLPILMIVSNALVVLAVFAFLVIVDPMLAATTVLVLGGAYVLTYRFLRARILRAGESWLESNQARYHVLAEAFTGIKEVKVLHAEESFAARFSSVSRQMCDAMIRSKVVGHVPSIAMQAVIFGGMLLVILYVLATRGGFAAGLPVIGLYAFAGYKMMPALQRIYAYLAEMEFSSVALVSLEEPLRLAKLPKNEGEAFATETATGPRVRLTKELAFRDLVYQYPGSDQPTLKRMNFSIEAGSKVGIVGTTGSGKTTTVDIILGLLRPLHGEVLVDGREIADSKLRAWQASIGYVPQTIFLADTTLAGNIAFGVPKDEIDHDRVETVSKLAKLHAFVVDEFPDKYESRAGERGVRLSGGERQRVGIARALYHDPDVLILDEATSALDNVTEKLVMQALDELTPSKTVIIIAHRLSTVRNCDTIFFLENGLVSGSGSFEALRASHPRFRLLAEGETGVEAVSAS